MNEVLPHMSSCSAFLSKHGIVFLYIRIFQGFHNFWCMCYLADEGSYVWEVFRFKIRDHQCLHGHTDSWRVLKSELSWVPQLEAFAFHSDQPASVFCFSCWTLALYGIGRSSAGSCPLQEKNTENLLLWARQWLHTFTWLLRKLWTKLSLWAPCSSVRMQLAEQSAPEAPAPRPSREWADIFAYKEVSCQLM